MRAWLLEPRNDAGRGDGQAPFDNASAFAGTCDAADPDLIACYSFERGGVDESGHGNDGAVGAGVQLVAGRVGMAARFTPISSFMVADAANLHPLAVTVEAWILVDQLTLRQVIVDSNGQWALAILGNGDVVCSGNNQLTAGVTIPTGQWFHVACTFEAAANIVYVSGSARGSLMNPGTPPTNGTMGIRIGGNLVDGNNPADDGLTGAIDELHVWRIARTAQQICKDADSC